MGIDNKHHLGYTSFTHAVVERILLNLKERWKDPGILTEYKISVMNFCLPKNLISISFNRHNYAASLRNQPSDI